jgi:hypothetical protein
VQQKEGVMKNPVKCLAYSINQQDFDSIGNYNIAKIYIRELDVLCHARVKRDRHSDKLIVKNSWPMSLVDRGWADKMLLKSKDVEEVFYSNRDYKELENLIYDLIDADELASFDDIDSKNPDEEDYAHPEKTTADTPRKTSDDTPTIH